MDSTPSRAPPDPLRTRPDDLPATPPATDTSTHPDASPVACLVCGVALHHRRPEARCCSGRCRAALSRQGRVPELAVRVRRAEEALRLSADALRELQDFAAHLGWRWPS